MRGLLKTTVVHILKFFELRHRSNHILESCRSGVMVSISAFQALDPGSIPGCDILFCALRFETRLFPANSDDFSSRNVESKFFFLVPPSARLQRHESWCVGICVRSLTSGRIGAVLVESSRVQMFCL